MIDINSISWNSSPDDINKALKQISQRGELLSDYPKLEEIVQYVFEESGKQNAGKNDLDVFKDALSNLGKNKLQQIILQRQVNNISKIFEQLDISEQIKIADEIGSLVRTYKIKIPKEIDAFISKREILINSGLSKFEIQEWLKSGKDIEELSQEITDKIPTNTINKIKLDELVETYEKAKSDDERNLVSEVIARYENIKVSQVEQFIATQKKIKVEKVEVNEAPESELTLDKIEMLVEEYEKASEKKQSEISAEIKEILERYKGKEKSEVDRLISRLKELKDEGLLEAKLENVIETKLEVKIPEILTEKDNVEKFADEMAKKGGHNVREKEEIKKIVLERIRGGEIRKETTIDPIEVKKIELETEKFIREHKNEVEADRVKKIEKAFNVAAENAPTEKEKQQILEYGKMVADFYRTPTPDLLSYKTEAENALKENITSPGKRQKAFDDTEVIVKAMYNSDLREVIEKAKGFTSLNKSLISGIREARSFEGMVDVVSKNPEMMLGMQKMVNAKIQLYDRFVQAAGKIPIVKGWVAGATEKIGGVAIKEFLAGAMKVMAEQGMVTGAKTIMQGIMLGSTAAAETAGGSALVTTMAGLFSALPPVAVAILVVMAVIVAYKVAYYMYDTLAGWVKNITGSDLLWGVRNFFVSIFGDNWFGKSVGTLGQFAFNGMVGIGVFGAMLFGPILAAGLAAMTAIVAPVVIGLTVGMMAYNLFVTAPMISSLVPPPPQGAGGTCQPKEDPGTPAPSSGEINCNQNAPASNVGIDKDNFVRLANNWHAGKNYAAECFNDVVNKALCAGINPQFALWAWLHESGASNYSIANVEDFGIHGQASAPPKNFDKQINYFLKLNPGNACSGLGYWLSFATNYLTGECDPKKGITQSDGTVMTGEKYLAAINEQWSWIKPGSLPSSIKGSTGGQNCGGNSSGLTAEGENEFVAADGTVMVCSGPVDENGNFIGIPGESKYDPNAPGLEGEKVEGECSVASKVVETKQCGQSWSSKSLPGGSGTICSAGCGPSSVSSILRNKNNSLTPDSVIFEPGSAYGGMNGDGSSLGQARDTLKKYGFNAGEVGKCSQQDIAGWIRQGKAVVFLSDSDTGNGSTIGHILVAVAISNGDIVVKDPYYSNSTPFATKGKGNIKNLRECLPVQLGLDNPDQCKNSVKTN